MSENKSSLEVLADASFLKSEFIFERAGWVFMVLVLVAAALGLFGNGFLSRTVLETDQFHMDYERYLHFGDLTSLEIKIPPHKSENGVLAIAIPNSYLHNFRIEKIIPEPESSAHGEQTLFWFTATNTGESVTVQIRLEPEEVGRMEGKIFVNGEVGYSFRQFVYP